MKLNDFLSMPELYKKIEHDQAVVNAMRARLYSPKGLDTREKVQASASGPELNDIVIDMQIRIDKQVAYLDGLRKEAEALINSKVTGDEQLILLLHYVDFISWADIVAITDKSPATVYRYRSGAIDKLFNITEVFKKE